MPDRNVEQKSTMKNTISSFRSSYKRSKNSFKPKEEPLAKPELTEEDIKYQDKREELMDYLRKKIIHAKIFRSRPSNAKSDFKATVNVNRKKEIDPLAVGNITSDFEGKPIKIQKIWKFRQTLMPIMDIDIPEEPTSVMRDPEEIAQFLGKPDDITSMNKTGSTALQGHHASSDIDKKQLISVPSQPVKKASNKLLQPKTTGSGPVERLGLD